MISIGSRAFIMVIPAFSRFSQLGLNVTICLAERFVRRDEQTQYYSGRNKSVVTRKLMVVVGTSISVEA